MGWGVCSIPWPGENASKIVWLLRTKNMGGTAEVDEDVGVEEG